MYRKPFPVTIEYTFLINIHITFINTDHTLGISKNLKNFWKPKSYRIFFCPKCNYIKTQYKKVTEKATYA